MEDSYSGWNCYVIVEALPDEDSEGNEICPYSPVLTDDDTKDGNQVYRNGVYYISSAYVNPYNDWISTVTGWQINVDTGEVRYYAASGADEEYFTPEQRAIGKVTEFSVSNERTLENHNSLGEYFIGDIKSTTHEVSIDIDKVFIDKKKLAAISRTSPLANQAGFAGSGLSERTLHWEPVNGKWFFVMLYIKDASSDTDNVGRIIIMPCAKFEGYKPSFKNKEIITASMTGQARYAFCIPDDLPNIEEYTPTGTPP